MAGPNKALFSTCVAILGFVCFAIGATAVGIPVWGYFDTPFGGPNSDKGYFGPWKTCKLTLYNKEKCRKDDSRFRPTNVVLIAGVVAVIGVVDLGIFCVHSVIQLAMISSKEKVVMKYSVVLISRLILALIATFLAIGSAGIFALQTDDVQHNGFRITRGPGFYLQIVLIFLNGCLAVMSFYDMLLARSEDPTERSTITVPPEGTTFGNPGYRERRETNVSMTDASGRPYVNNGSVASMVTTMTSASSVASNGSTADSSVTRSPLRSSLKKPKPKDGFGIQNPGFSGSSPTFSRNGSMKKVRIQTHSTEV